MAWGIYFIFECLDPWGLSALVLQWVAAYITVPFGVLNRIRYLIFRGTPKRDHDVENHPNAVPSVLGVVLPTTHGLLCKLLKAEVPAWLASPGPRYVNAYVDICIYIYCNLLKNSFYYNITIRNQ